MRINQNISAMNTHASMVKSDNSISKSLERLSSGLRINRAADDAAGLAISEKMRGQIRGLQQAGRNAQDGISLLQTAEGALNETHSILQRMRELSVQAANDTLTGSDRAEIQKEMDQLTKEIDRIAGNTEFNTKSLLRGNPGSMTVSGATLTGGAAGTPAVAATGAIDLNAGNLTAGTQASGELQFQGGFENSFSIDINGHTITGADFLTHGSGLGTAAEDAADFQAYVAAHSATLGVTATYQNSGVWGAGEYVRMTATANGSAGTFTVDNSLAGFTTNQHVYDAVGVDGDSVNVNGTILMVGNQFAAGASASDTAANLATYIHNNTGALGVDASNIPGQTSVSIAANAAGTAGNAINLATSRGGVTAMNGGADLVAGTAASGTLTLNSLPTAGATVTVHGNTYTFVASGGDGTSTINIGASANDTAGSLATAIGTRDAAVTAVNNNGVITITAAATGTGGNLFNLATDAGSQTLTMHIGANAGQSMTVSLDNMDAGSLGIGRDGVGAATVAGNDAVQGLDVTTQAAANSAITTIDAALSTVSSERSKLGAYQNRLEHTISNLGAAAENLSSSESRIRDVDMAEEMANFSRSQILMQASTAMMAQANQKPQAVLKLLG